MRHPLRLLVPSLLAALALTACGDDKETVKSSASGPQGNTATTGFTCCLSGTTYTCPTQAAEKKCAGLDPSDCTKTSVSADGHCPHP